MLLKYWRFFRSWIDKQPIGSFWLYVWVLVFATIFALLARLGINTFKYIRSGELKSDINMWLIEIQHFFNYGS